MEYLFTGMSLIEVEPYFLGFVAGVIYQKLYVVNKWRFEDKKHVR